MEIALNHYETIAQYYKAYGHTPPLESFFDVRRFEQYYVEEKTSSITYSMQPFRVDFYGIGLLENGDAEKHLGKKFDANVIFYTPYQLLSFSGVARNWKGYYTMFDQNFLSRCSFGKSLLTDFPFLRLDKVHPIKLLDEQRDNLMSIFQKIYAEFYSTKDDKFKFIENYLNLILLEIKRITAGLLIEDSNYQSKAETNLVARFKSLLDSHLNKNELESSFFSPGYYAEKLNVHPNYLNAVTKRTTGSTAKQLIKESLVVVAKSLLLQTSLSVKEIAYKLSFEDPAHFINIFKKSTNTTPAQFRRSEIL